MGGGRRTPDRYLTSTVSESTDTVPEEGGNAEQTDGNGELHQNGDIPRLTEPSSKAQKQLAAFIDNYDEDEESLVDRDEVGETESAETGTGIEDESAVVSSAGVGEMDEVTVDRTESESDVDESNTSEERSNRSGNAEVDLDEFEDANEAARYLGPTDEQSIDVDLGPTDPEVIEDEFGMTLTETKTVTNIHRSSTDHSYQTLDFSQIEKTKKALIEKHGEEVYNDLDGLFSSWKGGQDKEDKQTLELIAKKAHGIGQPVRRGGEKSRDVDPDDSRIDAYRDISRISRAFLKANVSGEEDGEQTITVHRGVRMANETLTAQFIDNPTADAYQVQTSATSNHSTDDGVANSWGNPYTIQHKIHPDDVTVAIDHVQVSGMDEGEIHIDSDNITVPRDGIGFAQTKHLHDGHETVADVYDTFSDPKEATRMEHRDVHKLLEAMSERGEAPRTEEGARNLLNYFDNSTINEDLTRNRLEETHQLVDETLERMETEHTVRGNSKTMGAITDPASATVEEHKRALNYITPYSHNGIRDGHTDEDAEQLVEWVNHLSDDQPMDATDLRTAHRNVEKILDEADTDVTLEIDRFDMGR